LLNTVPPEISEAENELIVRAGVSVLRVAAVWQQEIGKKNCAESTVR
jgi:hypothetical protein